jgi:hypothetical protein
MVPVILGQGAYSKDAVFAAARLRSPEGRSLRLGAPTSLCSLEMTAEPLISGGPVRHPEVVNDEKDALLASLNSQREHVLGALEGLSEDDLRRQVLPSGWTPLGMARHLALEVEQFWFRGAVAGEPITLTSGDEAWQVPADVPGAAILELYRGEVAKADEIIAATPIDAMPKWWPDFFENFPPRPLRKTILHVITETATHAGHMDAARELIDGGQWIVLTR